MSPNVIVSARDLANAHLKLGELYVRAKQFDQARVEYLNALKLCQEIVDAESDDTIFLGWLAQAYVRLVEVEIYAGKNNEAIKYERKVIEIRKKMLLLAEQENVSAGKSGLVD